MPGRSWRYDDLGRAIRPGGKGKGSRLDVTSLSKRDAKKLHGINCARSRSEALRQIEELREKEFESDLAQLLEEESSVITDEERDASTVVREHRRRGKLFKRENVEHEVPRREEEPRDVESKGDATLAKEIVAEKHARALSRAKGSRGERAERKKQQHSDDAAKKGRGRSKTPQRAAVRHNSSPTSLRQSRSIWSPLKTRRAPREDDGTITSVRANIPQRAKRCNSPRNVRNSRSMRSPVKTRTPKEDDGAISPTRATTQQRSAARHNSPPDSPRNVRKSRSTMRSPFKTRRPKEKDDVSTMVMPQIPVRYSSPKLNFRHRSRSSKRRPVEARGGARKEDAGTERTIAASVNGRSRRVRGPVRTRRAPKEQDGRIVSRTTYYLS